MSFPNFNASCFLPITNQPPNNFTSNNVTHPIQPFQQNPMPFLSFPPPNIAGSQHVFHTTPSRSINVQVSSPMFPPNIINQAANPAPFLINSQFNVPDVKNDMNLAPSNPLQDFGSLFNQNQTIQNPIQSFSNFRSSIFLDSPSNTCNNYQQNSRNFQLLPGSQSLEDFKQKGPSRVSMSLQNISPSHGNNQNRESGISPWIAGAGPQNVINNFYGIQNEIHHSPQKHSESLGIPWAQSSGGSSIDPWIQSPHNGLNMSPWGHTSGSSRNSSHSPRNNLRSIQTDIKSSKFERSNFNNKRHDSRNSSNNFQNKSHVGFGNEFKMKQTWKQESEGKKTLTCDTCDRSFPSDTDLKFHLSEHIKCNGKNCNFEAHPKVVALHKKMQHDTGYAETINKLKNDDEIEKWRAERRRRFPTFENVLKRKAEQAEKEARGEVIETKDFGKFKRQRGEPNEQRRDRFSARGRNRHHNSGPRTRNRPFRSDIVPTHTISDSDDDGDSHIKLHKFPGMLATDSENIIESVDALIRSVRAQSEETKEVCNENEKLSENESKNKEHIDSQTNDETENVVTEQKKTHTIIGNEIDDEIPIELHKDGTPLKNISPLNEDMPNRNPDKQGANSHISKEITDISLVESDSGNETPSEIPIIKVSNCKEDSDDESPIEVPIPKVPMNGISTPGEKAEEEILEMGTNKPLNSEPAEKGEKKNYRRNEQSGKFARQKFNQEYESSVSKSTLLEKLLADDIRHERNVMMQCIRHIVKKKYFGIGSQSTNLTK